MKKTLLACIAVAAISTNCSASEVVGTANTMAQTVASATNLATNVANKYDKVEPVVVEAQPEEAEKPSRFKWINDGKAKLDEVLGGRESINKLQEENEDLKSELRILKAKTSFTAENLKPFAQSVEKMCYLYDGGGIKEAIGGE